MKNEIKELMKLKGWKQSELADAVGVHESTVWRWIDEGAMPIPIIQGIVRQLLAEAREEARQPATQSA